MSNFPSPPVFPSEYEPDFIIIGGGTAGCVLAYRLSKTQKVLLIEAGPPDTNFPEVMDLAKYYKLTDPGREYNFSQLYPTVNEKDGSTVSIPRAKILGGCSSHNNAISLRTFKQDLDLWESLGVTGWDFDTVNRCLDKLKITIQPPDKHEKHEVIKHWIASCKAALRVPDITDFNTEIKNGGFGLGVGRFNFAYTGGFRRSSASTAYIHNLLADPNESNLLIMFSSRVTHFEITKREVLTPESEVPITERGVSSIRIVSPYYTLPEKFKAKKEIILCAGVFDTPRILLHSGIGPKADLEKLRIPVNLDLPGVGENLQDRVACPILWEIDDKLQSRGPVNPSSGLFLRRSGSTEGGPDLMLTTFQPPDAEGSETLQFSTSDEGSDVSPPPTNQYTGYAEVMTKSTFRNLALGQVGWWAAPQVEDEDDARSIGVSVTIPHPYSRGKLSLQSKEIFAKPVLDFRYLSDKRDAMALVHGIRTARKIASIGPFKDDEPTEMLPGSGTTTTKKLLEYVRKNRSTGANPVGTTKMGALSDKLAVVDSKLQVIGMKGLMIADAGVFPTLTIATPYLTVLAIGERCAELIKEKHGVVLRE